MKNIFLIPLALAAAQAFAVPCPMSAHAPEGAEVFPSCTNIALFRQNGQYGYFNPENGEIIAPAQFDEVRTTFVSPFLNPVRKGEKWAYVDGKGQAKTPYEYDHAEDFLAGKDSAAIVGKNGRFGIINTQFQVIAPIEYTRIDSFLDPEFGRPYWLAAACKDGKCGFLNEKGEIAIAFEYEDAGGFGAAVAPVKKGGKWGYIDAKGKTVQPFEFDYAPPFGRYWTGDPADTCVEAEKDGKRVVIDRKGNILPEDTLCLPVPPPLV